MLQFNELNFQSCFYSVYLSGIPHIHLSNFNFVLSYRLRVKERRWPKGGGGISREEVVEDRL